MRLSIFVLFCFLLLLLISCNQTANTNRNEEAVIANLSEADIGSGVPTPPAGYTGEIYTGKLFDTSLQMGDGGSEGISISQLISNMNRNNVAWALAMFGIDPDDENDLEEGSSEGIDHLRNAIVAAPARLVPYFIQGTGNPRFNGYRLYAECAERS